MCGVSITPLTSGWHLRQDEEPQPPAGSCGYTAQQLEQAFPLFTATSRDPRSELKVLFEKLFRPLQRNTHQLHKFQLCRGQQDQRTCPDHESINLFRKESIFMCS